MDLTGFDARNEDLTAGPSFEPLAPGWYEVVIVESEEKDNRAGTGSYLELKMQVVKGPREGKNVWTRLNLRNPSEKAVAIARQQLGKICTACAEASANDRLLAPTASSDLHMIPIEIYVTNREYDNKIQEDVKDFRAIGGAAPAKAEAAAPAKKPASPW